MSLDLQCPSLGHVYYQQPSALSAGLSVPSLTLFREDWGNHASQCGGNAYNTSGNLVPPHQGP